MIAYSEKKALYQEDSEENIAWDDEEGAKENKREPTIGKTKHPPLKKQSGRRTQPRYDAWYMPRKYWSKVKDTADRSSKLHKLRTDPKHLYKTLYDSGMQSPL